MVVWVRPGVFVDQQCLGLVNLADISRSLQFHTCAAWPIFCGLLALTVRRLPARWRLCLAILVEAVWEVIENSNYVIQRYREATASLGYQGDTVMNSMGDILCCGVGFVLALRLGWRRSVALFFAIEAVLLIWIRDSLLLEVIMLIHPIDAIKAWQIGH